MISKSTPQPPTAEPGQTNELIAGHKHPAPHAASPMVPSEKTTITLSYDEGQTNEQGRAADVAVSDEQVDAAMEGFHFTATGLPRRADMRCALEQFAATQPPSASPVAVPRRTWQHETDLLAKARIQPNAAQYDARYAEGFNNGLTVALRVLIHNAQTATPPALPDAGLDSQKGGAV